MTSLYGTFESFDYDSFKEQRCRQPEQTTMRYPDDTLMSVLMKDRPRLAQIIINSKYDQKFADPQASMTVFASDYWEQLSPAEVNRLDIDACKKIVMYNTVNGRIRTEDLQTSDDSQLFPLGDTTLHIWLDIRDGFMKKENERILGEYRVSNGIIHWTSSSIQI